MDHRRKPTPTTSAPDDAPPRISLDQIAAHEENVAMLFATLAKNNEDDKRLATADIAVCDKLCSMLGRFHVLNIESDNPLVAAFESANEIRTLHQLIYTQRVINYWKKRDTESAANGDAAK